MHTTPLRVLVVDDYADAADSLCRLLRSLGYVAHAHTSAATAREDAVVFAPDVAILDLAMPGENGLDLAGYLVTLQTRPYLIALIGLQIKDIEQQARAVGFDAFLLKPATPAKLQQVLADGRRVLTG